MYHYVIVVIAISVILSTAINIFIMKKVTEIATKEIDKIEQRVYQVMNINQK